MYSPQEVNANPDVHQYLDDTYKIEYRFTGFEGHLPLAEKQKLIERFGKPHNGSDWEVQTIYNLVATPS